MAVATITLESSNGDSVVVSAPNDEYLADDIILDTDPKGMYDTRFTVRTQSGAFEPGGRAVGESIPIREPVLPFWLTPESRPRFQRLWGTPGNLQKVKCTWDGPSGPRFLYLKLAGEIQYTTEDGFDADIDKVYHAVVSAHAYNPMFEGVEDVASWQNPDDRFALAVVADGGTFPLSFGGNTTSDIAWNAAPSAVQAALESLPSVGAGKVTVTGTAATASTTGNYLVVFAVGTNGVLTGSADDLSGTGPLGLTKSLTIDYAPNTGWFEVWNPTDQKLWPEWEFDPAKQWQFPDFGFGQERKWGRPVGSDAARMIVTPQLTQLLSVMSDPFMDTYVSADLSNAAGLFNGVEPIYPVPPYTGTEADPVLVPVVCKGPAGAKATLRQRRFWSAESGLEA
ncbi:minor tail protein [Mycobacterium phage IdentityCrisis]|uniref:Minor tail protein n=1 Tax=Mycobacterium phage IdentityCrisis TaxID=2599866 RepID=A0A5J6TH26_9CAUD|nr:minor tail protein [Mycobacterium phage IdentityCrisis]QFG10036.1 minor tail protein [Mycobacterium phage IdentityCrisis]